MIINLIFHISCSNSGNLILKLSTMGAFTNLSKFSCCWNQLVHSQVFFKLMLLEQSCFPWSCMIWSCKFCCKLLFCTKLAAPDWHHLSVSSPSELELELDSSSSTSDLVVGLSIEVYNIVWFFFGSLIC
jgi:hypothetical protein